MNPPTTNPVSTIAPAAGGLPKLTLVAPDGAQAEVYLYGAHVVSWVPGGGQERLFLSRTSAFRAGAPIRGGVPVVFPQFGTTGPLPLHGLVRLMAWELATPAGIEQQGLVLHHSVQYPAVSFRCGSRATQLGLGRNGITACSGVTLPQAARGRRPTTI